MCVIVYVFNNMALIIVYVCCFRMATKEGVIDVDDQNDEVEVPGRK